MGGLVSAAGRKRTYGTPTEAPSRREEAKNKKKIKKICRFRHAFSLKPALPQLYAYTPNPQLGGQESRREEKGGHAEGGRIKVGAVKKKSKGEVVG